MLIVHELWPPLTWESLLGTKIRIGNLPADADRYSLEDLLTMVGDVRTFRLEKVEDVGIAKTVAFVEMAEDSQARDCISRFNNTAFRGVTITVREDVVFVPRVRPVQTRSTKSKRRVSASR